MKKSESKKGTLLAAVCLAAAAAVLLLVWQTLAPKGEAGDKTVAVQVVHGDGSTQEFVLKTESAYLGPALVDGGVVADDRGDYGLYIQTADGETADSANQEWWCVTRGGEALNTGADSTPIADGEHYELTLTVGYD